MTRSFPSEVSETLSGLPLIEVQSGYWERAGALRAKVLAKRRKARFGDALIAQSAALIAEFLFLRAIGTSGLSPMPPHSIS